MPQFAHSLPASVERNHPITISIQIYILNLDNVVPCLVFYEFVGILHNKYSQTVFTFSISWHAFSTYIFEEKRNSTNQATFAIFQSSSLGRDIWWGCCHVCCVVSGDKKLLSVVWLHQTSKGRCPPSLAIKNKHFVIYGMFSLVHVSLNFYFLLGVSFHFPKWATSLTISVVPQTIHNRFSTKHRVYLTIQWHKINYPGEILFEMY